MAGYAAADTIGMAPNRPSIHASRRAPSNVERGLRRGEIDLLRLFRRSWRSWAMSPSICPLGPGQHAEARRQAYP